MRIAVWSGPRNLSTALMYSFAARGDCSIWDEPFYAAYLAKTDIDHPMRAAVIAAGEIDPTKVIDRLTAQPPLGKSVFYQKHMCQHMIADIPRGWLDKCRNVFLIRHPARVIASYAAKRENPELAELGFTQQMELYHQVSESAAAPIVIDASDIRDDPRRELVKLCAALGISFTEAMLAWPRGGHVDDGVWAPIWYGAVHKSTCFAGAEEALPNLSGEYARMAEAALPLYEKLRQNRL
jgi:hypothetical protein